MNFEQLIEWIRMSKCGFVGIYKNNNRLFVYPVASDEAAEENKNIRANAPVSVSTDEIVQRVQQLQELGYFTDGSFKFILKATSNSKENASTTLVGYYHVSTEKKSTNYPVPVMQGVSEDEKRLRDELQKMKEEFNLFKFQKEKEDIERNFNAKIEQIQMEMQMQLQKVNSNSKLEEMVEKFAPMLIQIAAQKFLKMPASPVAKNVKMSGEPDMSELQEEELTPQEKVVQSGFEHLRKEMGDEKVALFFQKIQNYKGEDLDFYLDNM